MKVIRANGGKAMFEVAGYGGWYWRARRSGDRFTFFGEGHVPTLRDARANAALVLGVRGREKGCK